MYLYIWNFIYVWVVNVSIFYDKNEVFLWIRWIFCQDKWSIPRYKSPSTCVTCWPPGCSQWWQSVMPAVTAALLASVKSNSGLSSLWTSTYSIKPSIIVTQFQFIYMWPFHWNIEVVTKSTESLMWLFTVWTCAWTLILLLRSSDTVWPPDTGTNQMILFPFYDYKVFT